MAKPLFALVALALASPLAAQNAPPVPDARECATIVVTRATLADLDKLREDADCFANVAAEWDALADYSRTEQASARASARYRTNRIAEIEKAAPPAPPALPPVDGIAEGDSNTAPGYSYASLFAAANPDIRFANFAVGGSQVGTPVDRGKGGATLFGRLDSVLARDPKFVTVLIGNNLGTDYLNRLWAYTAVLREAGIKVAVATVLPHRDSATREALRQSINAAIRAAVGVRIDAVIDFAADPRFGDFEDAAVPAIFGDGNHASMATHRLMFERYAPVVGALRNPPAPPVQNPVPGPTAAPEPGFILSPTLAGAAPVSAPFDVELGLVPSSIPAADGKGAFRFTCGGDGPLRFDDPVLYPGQPGRAHLHQVWGNRLFDADLTPERLHQSAATNCNDTPYSLNRSSYWMPALMHDSGEVIQPDRVSVYYKRWPLAGPYCTPGDPRFVGQCIGIPNRIRFIFGWDVFNPDAPLMGASWVCGGTSARNLVDLFAKGKCVVGEQLIAQTQAPHCWDGKHLDTPDHRSHLADYRRNPRTGAIFCPPSHPFAIPQQENKASFGVTVDMYRVENGVNVPRIGLSSDHMKPGAKAGETLHADYMEAWFAEGKAAWEGHCIDKGLNCSAGVLGNGFKLIGAQEPRYGFKNPSPRVAVPAR